MNNHRFGIALIAAGILLMGIAAGIIAANLLTEREGDVAAQTALESLKTEIPEPIPEPTKPAEELLPAATEPVEIPDYILNPNMDMPETEVDGVAYIGYLNFLTLELELPVITETTYPYLKISPCRFEGSAYLDDLVIGAHNYTRHFGQIGDLAYGDEITFTDLDGNVFHYEVANIEILQPHQVEELCSGEWPLTLYTCTLGGRTRVTVRCERIEA